MTVQSKSSNTISPLISAIIVSYNTRETTLECLRALYADLGDTPSEVWVVDNASTDGSVDAIRRDFPAVRIIENDKNLGFGAANNRAMEKAQGKYIFLVNSDAFMKSGATSAMIDFLERQPDAGAVGPRLLNKDGSLQRSSFKFPTPCRAWLENLWVSTILPNHSSIGDYRKWAHDEVRNVDSLIGACMLVRREAYDQVGGFDERFFMYSEETDWQWRMKEAGWKIGFTPLAEVVHLGGQSGAGGCAKINHHFFESLDKYVLKHHGRLGLLSFRAAMTIGCFLRTILWAGQIAIPGRRALACSKARLLSWLCFRQATYWRIEWSTR